MGSRTSTPVAEREQASLRREEVARALESRFFEPPIEMPPSVVGRSSHDFIPICVAIDPLPDDLLYTGPINIHPTGCIQLFHLNSEPLNYLSRFPECEILITNSPNPSHSNDLSCHHENPPIQAGLLWLTENSEMLNYAERENHPKGATKLCLTLNGTTLFMLIRDPYHFLALQFDAQGDLLALVQRNETTESFLARIRLVETETAAKLYF